MTQMQASPSADARPAPPGFTEDALARFLQDGFFVLDERLSEAEIEFYLNAADEVFRHAEACSRPHGGPFDASLVNKVANLSSLHPAFADLIDHNRHIGFAYDIFGEQLKLIQSELFYRPTGKSGQKWHIDGPRALPYAVFSGALPLKLRVTYWLTDLSSRGHGNFVYIPGSHLPTYSQQHYGHDPVPEEVPLLCKPGTVTVQNGSIWHRVEANESPDPRIAIFMSYSPSWIVGYYDADRAMLKRLTREQRIIVRPYGDDQEAFTRPPADQYPLFLDRERHADKEPDAIEQEERHKWRRYTAHEKLRQAVSPRQP
jgi:Phytanoyl-CoA dioxygenase (PhyH)